MSIQKTLEEMRRSVRIVRRPELAKIQDWLHIVEAEMREKEAEIERLTMERDEARKLVSELSNEGGAEIERLRKALQQIANRAIPIQREEHRIARAALAEKEGPIP